MASSMVSSPIARVSARLLKAFGYLPPTIARPIAATLAQLTVTYRRQDLKIAFRNLELAFPNWSISQRRQTVKNLVRNLGWMGAEFARFPYYAQQHLESFAFVDGAEHIARAFQKGNGVIILSGHLCSWELLAFAVGKSGINGTFPVRTVSIPGMDEILNHYRALSGNLPVPREKCARALVRALRANRAVGILLDEDVPHHEKPIFVDFFGIPAATSTSAARLVKLTGAAVIPSFIHRDSSLRKYRISCLPEIATVRTGDAGRDIRENTARFSRALEAFIRAHPDQWLWLQPRWQTRPVGEASPFQKAVEPI